MKRSFPWLLLAVSLLGLLLRVDIAWYRDVGFVVDADESIVGLMGRHILEGRGIPVFYYGQHYMGSLEAICAAAVFAVLGPTALSLKLVPLLWSVALTVLVGMGTRAFYGAGAGIIAALFVALAPSGFLVWSGMARGGFIEIIVIITAICFGLLWWWQNKLLRMPPLVVAALFGLGWWTNNQVIFVVPLIGVVAVGVLLYARGLGRAAEVMRTAGLCLLVALLCSSPFWIHNIRHDFPSTSLFKLASPQARVEQGIGVITTALPIVFGAQRFWEGSDLFPGATWVMLLLVGVPVVVAAWRSPVLRVGLLIVPWAGLLFALSSYGFLVRAPRYLLPLYPIVCVVVAVVLMCWTQWLRVVWLLALVAFNVANAYLMGRAQPGMPFMTGQERIMRDHRELIQFLDAQQITKIRTNYWVGYRLAFETGERVTFGIVGEPEDDRLPDYNKGVNERTPLLLAPSQVRDVVEVFKAQGRTFSSHEFVGNDRAKYVLLYNISASSCERAITPASWTMIESAPPAKDLLTSEKSLKDKDPGTRWASHAPQAPDMFIRVRVAAATKAPVQVRWSEGNFTSDFPRGLQLLDQRGEPLVSERAVVGLKFLKKSAAKFVCVPAQAREITFRQTGRDTFFDWSVAELEVLQ